MPAVEYTIPAIDVIDQVRVKIDDVLLRLRSNITEFYTSGSFDHTKVHDELDSFFDDMDELVAT